MTSCDNRRDSRYIRLADAEVAAPVLFLEAVVPVIVLAMGDGGEPVDLAGDVVVHEERIAVPARMPRVAALLRGERQVLLLRHAFWRAEADDLARAVAGPPMAGVAVIGQAEIVCRCLDSFKAARRARHIVISFKAPTSSSSPQTQPQPAPIPLHAVLRLGRNGGKKQRTNRGPG